VERIGAVDKFCHDLAFHASRGRQGITPENRFDTRAIDSQPYCAAATINLSDRLPVDYTIEQFISISSTSHLASRIFVGSPPSIQQVRNCEPFYRSRPKDRDASPAISC
jgi:hypothetical protein